MKKALKEKVFHERVAGLDAIRTEWKKIATIYEKSGRKIPHHVIAEFSKKLATINCNLMNLKDV